MIKKNLNITESDVTNSFIDFIENNIIYMANIIEYYESVTNEIIMTISFDDYTSIQMFEYYSSKKEEYQILTKKLENRLNITEIFGKCDWYKLTICGKFIITTDNQNFERGDHYTCSDPSHDLHSGNDYSEYVRFSNKENALTVFSKIPLECKKIHTIKPLTNLCVTNIQNQIDSNKLNENELKLMIPCEPLFDKYFHYLNKNPKY